MAYDIVATWDFNEGDLKYCLTVDRGEKNHFRIHISSGDDSLGNPIYEEEYYIPDPHDGDIEAVDTEPIYIMIQRLILEAKK